MSGMEDLRDRIQQAFIQNARGQEFMPRGQVNAIITRPAVRDVLLERNVEKQNIPELVDRILQGARRIFAILVCIRIPEYLLNFVHRDQLQPTNLDHLLPFELATLQTWLPDSAAPRRPSREFHLEQWRFAVPVFDGTVFRRVLDTKITLPYLVDEPMDERQEGAYGRMYKVQIERSHRQFNRSQNLVSSPNHIPSEY